MSGTNSGIIDPLVSKRPGKNLFFSHNFRFSELFWIFGRKKLDFWKILDFWKKLGFSLKSWIFRISLWLFFYFFVIFWISQTHYPIIAPLCGSHGLSAWRAWRTKSSRPEGPLPRSNSGTIKCTNRVRSQISCLLLSGWGVQDHQ